MQLGGSRDQHSLQQVPCLVVARYPEDLGGEADGDSSEHISGIPSRGDNLGGQVTSHLPLLHLHQIHLPPSQHLLNHRHPIHQNIHPMTHRMIHPLTPPELEAELTPRRRAPRERKRERGGERKTTRKTRRGRVVSKRRPSSERSIAAVNVVKGAITN